MTCNKTISNLRQIWSHLKSNGLALADFEDAINEAIELLKKKESGLIIELPCKVGDMVYAYCDAVNQIVGYSVEDIHINDEKTSFFATAFDVYFDNFLDEKEFTLDDIGEAVFLTKEEAEAKLKEIQNGKKV